uniref:Bm13021 n=1 Tax=Brugia malayi TaxID=6279 RepID=A0A1I9FZR8_BRUMA|nr:Bm13021 [Brugia malayi]
METIYEYIGLIFANDLLTQSPVLEIDVADELFHLIDMKGS